ncbi:MAG: InlB B-repeat-containing protein [Lachnospiraceae bacterium]|nr:InlB B-repeat-containing protein [Lachnospiraceae bacterium]
MELPEIIVTVEEVEETYLSEANSDLSDEEPELTRISTNTTWGETTLTDVRVIVEPNATLTLKGTVTISGKVTFEGGGYITRGSVDGYFYMDSADASLTMRDITVNGNSYNFKAEGGTEYTFIVKNGTLILDDYCKITNCDTYRPIVSLSDGELIVNKAKISNSSVMSGGIISVSRSTAKINGAEITDCRSRGTIGAISISSGTAKLNGVKITNCTAPSSGGAINMFNSEVEIKGSEITNCRCYNMGGAIYMHNGSTLDVWDTTIADCKASFYGGAFDVVSDSTLKIHSGTYRNNSTTSTTDLVSYGGGCIRNINSEVYIYGGDFIENTSPIKGGCIYHAGSNSITYLYGGYFKGNTCETEEYKGSGAVFNGARNEGETYLYISGDVQFVGDEEYGFGADGIYLDQNEENGVARKIWIIDPLKSRINIYVKAKEGYVIAEGSDYTITDSDRNKMNVINVGDDDGPWYKVLDEEKNQVYLTKIKNTATYTVEHYQQNLDESGYTIVESYTQELEGTIGETVTATPISYPGFTENTDYESRIASGEVTEDGDLVLRLYYDRNIYNIYFVLNYGNSGSEEPFETQTVRFGNKLNEVTEPSRRGYSFKGWYINPEGTGNRWNFNDKVEDITAERYIKEQSATLYAKWVDDIAPVLGATSYNTGYKDLGKWIVRKKDLVITVPITEEGSGIDKVEYTLTPENGDVISGEVQYASAYAPRQIRTDSILQLNVENGQTVARITISEDYEGTVSLRCADKAENLTKKLLTANGGGIIVEDNAPQIDVTVQDEKDGKRVVDVAVSDILISNESVPDDADLIGNGNYIISGITDISYRIDDKAEQTVLPQNYNNPQYASEDKDSMLLSCEFSIDISGSGEHSLYISATDNAGNVSSKTTTVSITEPKTEEKPKKKTKVSNTQTGTATYIEETTDVFTPFVQLANPQPPKDTEPQTGDTSKRVEIYATMAMIAGMFYILLYFCTGKNGMTEEEKNEFISKILAWAKRGSKIRKPIAIAVIFWVLFYYHSIGKRVQVEWDEVYVK